MTTTMTTTPRIRTETEIRDALQRLIDAAYGRRAHPCFSIPVQSKDADVIMQDVIEEVLRYRSKDMSSYSFTKGQDEHN